MKISLFEKKKIKMKIIFSSLVILWFIYFLTFNLWFLPEGYHLAVGTRHAPLHEMDIFTVSTTRWTSFIFAKYAKNKCDAASFQNGILKPGKNLALESLILSYDEENIDNDAVLELFKDRLKVCDVNSYGEKDSTHSLFTPLQNGIILKHPALVNLLLAAGARTDLRMPIRGKRTDNMNALELATLMTTGKLNKEKMLAANKILTLLQEHKKNKKLSER